MQKNLFITKHCTQSRLHNLQWPKVLSFLNHIWSRSDYDLWSLELQI